MKRIPFLFALLPLVGFAEYGLPALNEGVNLIYDPADPEGLPLQFSWGAQPGRVYFVEYSAGLETDDWKCLAPYYPSRNYAAGTNPWLKRTFNDDRTFLRLRYTEERINVQDFSSTADSDHDGLADSGEIALHNTLPFKNVDLDANELPDDWEKVNPPNPEYPEDFATRFAAFRRDWVRGSHLSFGAKILEFVAADEQNHTIFLNGEFTDGSAKIVYTDNTYSTVSSIHVYPRLNGGYGPLLDDSSGILETEPSATYTAVTDTAHPELSGLVFTSTGAGGFIGRDLLRTLETSLVPAGSSLPTGATVPMPYRRVIVPLTGGGTEIRRIPAPLAITSLPLTQISPTLFPVIVRDTEISKEYYPNFNNTPILGILLPESVKPELDADGLPEAARNPSLPFDSGTHHDTFNSPATCRQWFRYPSAVTYFVSGVPPTFIPPGSSTTYPFGHFSEGFAPHKNDVNNTGAFTSEMHMTLDYTQDTRLYFTSDDDCWIFINGKLVEELDLGGPHPVGQEERTISFTSLQSRLGLTATTGTCRVAIFHADRHFTPAELRFISTDPLRPVYTYQVIADSMTGAPIIYGFALDATTGLPKAPAGMEISPTTGKIMWNLYGLKDGNGQSVVIPVGNHPVTVRVTDNLGHSDEQTFTILVGI